MAPIIVPAKAAHTATMIILHGLGDSGLGWAPVARMISQSQHLQHLKFVLPNAATMPVSIFQGMPAPSWFDIRSISMTNPDEDEQGILTAAQSIQRLVKSEIDAGIPANRIVLGGFSQGGATALVSGLTSEVQLAGIVALSCWLPLHEQMKGIMAPVAKETPVFWGHGTADGVVPFVLGTESIKALKSLGFPERTLTGPGHGVTFQKYVGMEHSSDPKELADLMEFLQSVVPSSSL